jgi:hypothetical protein
MKVAVVKSFIYLVRRQENLCLHELPKSILSLQSLAPMTLVKFYYAKGWDLSHII